MISRTSHLDRVLSPDDFPDPETVEAARSRAEVIVGFVQRQKPTLRQLLASLAGARGHLTIAGTPEQVADLIEDWFNDGAADGFNLMPPVLPHMLDVFVAEVVPLLQRRGLFRTGYDGATLRDHLGLDQPPSQFAATCRMMRGRCAYFGFMPNAFATEAQRSISSTSCTCVCALVVATTLAP